MNTYIAQGEQAIGGRADDMIQTILGSCVAVCLWDAEARVGGMNHILVPHAVAAGVPGAGATAMERLINALMRRGAERRRLRAKVFGGASVVDGLSDIGARNTGFVMRYLEKENIPCMARSTGGTMARQLRFWPVSGRASQRLLQPGFAPRVRLELRPEGSEVELF